MHLLAFQILSIHLFRLIIRNRKVIRKDDNRKTIRTSFALIQFICLLIMPPTLNESLLEGLSVSSHRNGR